VGLGFKAVPKFSKEWWRLLAFFFVITASHGVLDAMTNGGLGVAFFAPFDSTRYFFPWRPIVVSPIGFGSFFSHWGALVLLSEIKYVWVAQ
jgi:inner membrane protein